MPYIKDEDRGKFYPYINPLAGNIDTEGELNYVISCLCNIYLHRRGVKYATMNAIMGVLDCAGKEFYRRVAAPYEDRKIAENGDVY